MILHTVATKFYFPIFNLCFRKKIVGLKLLGLLPDIGCFAYNHHCPVRSQKNLNRWRIGTLVISMALELLASTKPLSLFLFPIIENCSIYYIIQYILDIYILLRNWE